MIREITYLDGSKHVVEFTDKGHRYKVDGHKVTGVTTILSFKDKSGYLLPWASRLAVEAKNAGASDYDAMNAHRTVKDKAGDLGTRIHTYIEEWLQGNAVEVTDDMMASVEGFHKWWTANKPDTIGSEDVVYSPEHDYCGKLDWRGNLDGRYGLIDFKTGNSDEEYNSYRKQKTGRTRAKTEHFIQNAGYDIPLIEEYGTPAEFYGVLYIPVSGNVQYFETTNTKEAQDAFIATLQAQRGWKSLERLNEYEERS